jgi:hypothetical protein
MTQQIDTAQMIETLESFLTLYNAYPQAIADRAKPLRVTNPRDQQVTSPEEMLRQLQRMEPQVTNIVLNVLGDGSDPFGFLGTFERRNLIAYALTMDPKYFIPVVTALLQKTIGTLEVGPWPPKTPTPVLVVHDAELRQRCADLLSASGNYDRVIREATTVLEDRIKRRIPSDVLAQRMPHTGDRTLGKLTDEFFSPGKLVLSISNDRTRQVALFKMLQGVDSYLRNHYHHQLDSATEWSWAWSALGLIDHLLADIDICVVQTP